MENLTENRLVITSGSDSGKEYQLLQERTTVGSAPLNDVQLNDRGVADFHAEIRIDADAFMIFDFNSEKGTFVNEERVTKEKPLAAGDTIRMGSAQAVFLPHNAVLAKENRDRAGMREAFQSIVSFYKKWCADMKVNLQTVLERAKPYYDKWMTRKNQKILAWVLPIIALCMIFAVISKDNAPDPGEAAAQRHENSHSTDAINTVNPKDNTSRDPVKTVAAEIETKEPDQRPVENAVGAAGIRQRQPGPGQNDPFADIYFSLAAEFADQQLWQIALEYYHRIFEKDPANPELSAKIAEMKSEIRNQTAYEKAEALIKQDRYQEGIAKLNKIAENSFYFHKAARVITAAKEKMEAADDI
jgi:pSer/pThr/pTyr-binding forkhead associated (FHA) protein